MCRFTDNNDGLAVNPTKRIDLAVDTRARDVGITHEAQALTTVIIIHSQDTELAGDAKCVRLDYNNKPSRGRSATGIDMRDPRALRRSTPIFLPCGSNTASRS